MSRCLLFRLFLQRQALPGHVLDDFTSLNLQILLSLLPVRYLIVPGVFNCGDVNCHRISKIGRYRHQFQPYNSQVLKGYISI